MDSDEKLTQKFLLTVPDQMHQFLEEEMSRRGLDSVQETVRQIISQAMIQKSEK